MVILGAQKFPCSRGTFDALSCGEVEGQVLCAYVRAFLEIFPRKIGHSTMAGRIVKKWIPLSKIWGLCYTSFSTGYPLKG